MKNYYLFFLLNISELPQASVILILMKMKLN